jgi:phage shock protein C
MDGRRLTRSRDDRMIAGVAGGLAEYLDIDPSIVRVVWALLVFAWGFGLLAYIVMAIVVPEEDEIPGGQPWAAPGSTAAGSTAPGSTATGATDPTAGSPLSPREARRAARRARSGDEGRTVAIVGGGLLVLIGAAFLLREFIPAIDFDFFWPLVLVVLGIVIVVGALRPGSARDDSRRTGAGPTTGSDANSGLGGGDQA